MFRRPPPRRSRVTHMEREGDVVGASGGPNLEGRPFPDCGPSWDSIEGDEREAHTHADVAAEPLDGHGVKRSSAPLALRRLAATTGAGRRRRRARPCRRTAAGTEVRSVAPAARELVSVTSLVSESARAVLLGGSAGWPPRPPPRERLCLPPCPCRRPRCPQPSPRLVLGLQLIPPGVVSRSASLLLESGDGFGRKPLELRALVVEVLEGALTLEEADGAVARGASGRGSTASVVPAPSVPRGVCRC